jgi:spermidine/putrescine-binding protein
MPDNDTGIETTNRRRVLKVGGASALGLTGLAGCLTGGGGGGGDEQTTTEEDDSGGMETTESDGAMDFGGQEISVMLNVGAISRVHKKHLIPHVEQKYNLNINTTTAVTTTQLTKLQANQDDPPDVLIPDVIGIEKASRNEWLASLTDHADKVPNVENIYDKFVHYDGTGVSWQVGEVLPVINTQMWDSTPSSHAGVMKNSSSTAVVPFSWSGGPYLLLMASAIATGNALDSELDVEAGFQWLEENFKPNVSTEYGGVASAKQQLASGNVDALNLFWDYMVYDMFNNDQPIDPLFRLDPTGIPFAECVAVPSGTNNMDPALAYANECLSVEFQETVSENMGSGVTNKDASVAQNALDFGAVTADEFDQLTFPNFRYIWDNRSDWSQRWNEIFS